MHTYAKMVSVCEGCYKSGIFGQVFPDLPRLVREKMKKEDGYEAPHYRAGGVYDPARVIRKPRFWGIS